MLCKKFVVPPLETNCYLLIDENSKQSIIIDPGACPAALLSTIEKQHLVVTRIINTHMHFDHSVGVYTLQKTFGIPFYIHAKEQFWIDHFLEYCAMFGVKPEGVPRIDGFLTGDDCIQCGCLNIQVIETPGHTAGSVSFLIEQEKALFTGDTLFCHTIGRTDLPGGSFEQMRHSIVDVLFSLSDDIVVYPGHGAVTSIGAERTRILHEYF